MNYLSYVHRTFGAVTIRINSWEIGKWYYFYNLMSGAPTEVRQVTELIRDANGGCTTCRTRGTFEWDTPTKWINWIMKEL